MGEGQAEKSGKATTYPADFRVVGAWKELAVGGAPVGEDGMTSGLLLYRPVTRLAIQPKKSPVFHEEAAVCGSPRVVQGRALAV